MNSLLLSAALFAALPNLQMSEADPHGFDTKPVVATKSVEQGRVEQRKAVRDSLPAMNDADPHGFSRQPVVSTRTRAEVQAEVNGGGIVVDTQYTGA